MKKSALAVLFSLVLTFGVFAENVSMFAQEAAFNIREERLSDETVSFLRQYPIVYGLKNEVAENNVNRQLQQLTLYSFLIIRNMSLQSNSKATGSCVATTTFNSEGLLCFELTTNASIGNKEQYNHIDYVTFSADSGKKLYFWDIFSKNGAVRDAVKDIFMQQAKHSQPDKEWVKEKISNLGAEQFYLDAKKSSLAVVLTDDQNGPITLSVPIEKLKSMFDVSFSISA